MAREGRIMGDELEIELLVIATIGRRGESAKETYEFTIWHRDNGPDAVQASVEELERLHGRPMGDREWLNFLNVHQNQVENVEHTIMISIGIQNGETYQASLQLEGYKTRQELLRAALERLPASVRTGAVEYFCVDPTEIDVSD
ncbi:hypothetical protein [Actinomadura sp. 3N407]|uniref:hypothetical protein n=1 Tax=Actinomadura sp. 3N407 TaxID=3457423 RepID=UPI003FCE32D0